MLGARLRLIMISYELLINVYLLSYIIINCFETGKTFVIAPSIQPKFQWEKKFDITSRRKRITMNTVHKNILPMSCTLNNQNSI